MKLKYASDFLDAEFPGKNRMAIDQDDAVAGPCEHIRRNGAGQSGADDGDLGICPFRQRTVAVLGRHLEYLNRAYTARGLVVK